MDGSTSQRAGNFVSFHGVDQKKLKSIIRNKRRGSTNSTIPDFLKQIETLIDENGTVSKKKNKRVFGLVIKT